jgi:hypothetical protein
LSRFSRRERGTAEREPAGEIPSVVEGSCVERLAGVPTRSEVLSEARVSRLAGVSGAECESSRAKQVPAGEFESAEKCDRNFCYQKRIIETLEAE